MSLKNIELYGLEIISEDEVQESLKTLHGKPLALIKETEVSRLLKEYKQIEQYSLQLIPPDTMSIVILERTPVVAVKDGDKVNLLDAAGITVLSVPEKEKPISVPFLVDKSAKVGSPEFHSSVKVIRGMTPQLIEKVASVTAKDGDKVTVHLNDGTSVFWGEASENALKAKVLETTLEATAKNKIKEINISAPLSPVFK